MLMNNFLRDRKSIRDFKNRKIKREVLDQVKEYCSQLGDDSSEFRLFEDGDHIYKSLKGVGGYSGMMIEGPHYIGLNIKDLKEKHIIYGAYNMEYLITELTSLNIGSCWISLKDVDADIKKKLFNIEEGEIDYLLAIGYPAARNPFISETVSYRLSIEDIVYDGEIGNTIAMDQLEHRGLDDLFYYIRFAPSSYNRQPWRFVLKDDRVILLLAHGEGEELLFVDAGIIMYYFESLAKTIGIANQWTLIDRPDYEDERFTYRYIGELVL